MTIEMRMKDGRKYTGDYAKVHGTMVSLHMPKQPDPRFPLADQLLVAEEGQLVALVPVADVLEIVRVEVSA